MFLIYCHKNKVNGKRYIGLTSYVDNPNKRWRDGKAYKNDHHRLFAGAIAKYGWDNFEHEILENNILDLKTANEREQYWIAFYHTYVGDPDCWGYNGSVGGDGSGGHIVSDAERELHRRVKLGTKVSDDTKAKMSATRKGKPRPMSDKVLESLKKIRSKSVQQTRRPVVCLETGEMWISITDCAQTFGLAEATISAHLNGRMKSIKNKQFHLKYLNEK